MKRIPFTTADAPSPPTEDLRTAVLHDVDATGVPWIIWREGEAPIAARISLPTGARISNLPVPGDEVMVLCAAGPGRSPIIVGSIAESIVGSVTDPVSPRPEPEETVTLRADRELVLECGEASVRLCADGRIEIRGGYVETYAEGTNRIKGAQVRIN